jgi:hypothetical protein
VDEAALLAEKDRVEAAKRAEAARSKGAADARNPVPVGHRCLAGEVGRVAFDASNGAFHLLPVGVWKQLLVASANSRWIFRRSFRSSFRHSASRAGGSAASQAKVTT